MDILQMSLSASVLIVAVVIIRALALHRLPKMTFLILWGVVVCRLLIPYSIPYRFSFYTGIDIIKRMFAENAITPSSPAVIASGANTANIAAAGETIGIGASTATAAISLSPIEIAWSAGMCVCALLFIVAYLKCRREFKTSLPVDNEFVACWLREYPLRRPLQIRQSDRIQAPLTYGVFRPVILLPKTIDWTDETGLKVILTHEMTHIRRFDTLTKLVLAASVCVHWFNPFVWVMYVLANRDIELSCDETVVRTFGESMKSAYALTLIGWEERKSSLAPLISGFSKNAIEERITAIMKIKRFSMPVIIVAVLLVVSLTVGFATSKAASEDGRKVSDSSGTSEQATSDAIAAAFDFDPSNYLFIPDTYFSSENNTEAFPFTFEQIQIFALIYGDHFIAAQVGDVLPTGIYVNEDGTEAYIFDKKADGSLIMTKYKVTDADKVNNDSYEIVEENTIEPPTTVEFTPSEGRQNYASRLLNQLQQNIQQAICSLDKIVDSKVEFNTDEGTCTVELLLTTEADLSDADIDSIKSFILKCTDDDLIELSAEDIQIHVSNDSATLEMETPAAAWVWPVEGCDTVTSMFGKRVHPVSGTTTDSDHICISGDKADGAKVYAALTGTVLETGYDTEQGNYIIITHDNGVETSYRHLKEVLVMDGDPVTAGDTIGTVGKTGTATGPCLAFSIYVDGKAVNPLDYLK